MPPTKKVTLTAMTGWRRHQELLCRHANRRLQRHCTTVGSPSPVETRKSVRYTCRSVWTQSYGLFTLVETDKNGLYSNVWRCSYCSATDNNANFHKYILSVSVSVSGKGIEPLRSVNWVVASYLRSECFNNNLVIVLLTPKYSIFFWTVIPLFG